MHGELDSALQPIAALLDLLNCAASIIHRSGLLVHVNLHLLLITGWKRNDLVGRSVLEIYPDADDRDYLQQVLTHFDEPRESEFYLPRADGSKLPVATAARTLAGPAPLPDYRVVTMIDNSRAKEAERQSKESYEFIVQMSNTVLEQALDLKNYSRTLEAKVEERTRELNEANLDAIYMLAEACEARDHDTGQHVRRIESISRATATRLGLSEREASVIGYSSILHDVGKLHIPDRILEKPGPLTDQERAEMERHTVVGESILSPRPFFEIGRVIARSHHENWDGSGYPDRLRHDAIPLAARIVHVADVFDALTAPRVYKQPWDHRRALEAMRLGSGTMFDPEVVRAFESLQSER